MPPGPRIPRSAPTYRTRVRLVAGPIRPKRRMRPIPSDFSSTIGMIDAPRREIRCALRLVNRIPVPKNAVEARGMPDIAYPPDFQRPVTCSGQVPETARAVSFGPRSDDRFSIDEIPGPETRAGELGGVRRYGARLRSPPANRDIGT